MDKFEFGDDKFVPTVVWMEVWYSRMNAELFGGRLGDCSFNIFTSGRGSEGGVLGWFRISGNGIKVERSSRHMYLRTMYGKEYIDSNNFVNYCKPRIELNGNYSATEEGWLGTLVHEMCHYYTYMNGMCPKQGHGPEFYSIGKVVCSRSDGLFEITRLASAETMKNFELNDVMKARQAKRLENKKSRAKVILVYRKNGAIELTMSSNDNIINYIIDYNEKRIDGINADRNGVDKIITSNDSGLIELLFSKGYKHNMRTYRYWNIGGKSWINEILDYDYELIYGSDNNSIKSLENGMNKEEEIKSDIIPLFRLNLGNTRAGQMVRGNNAFELRNVTKEEIRDRLKERFPNMKDDVIEKLMNNPNNYPKNEGRYNRIDSIISENINLFLLNEFNIGNDGGEDIDINPDMNLGEYSPLEDVK